jgi:hypothetical protein
MVMAMGAGGRCGASSPSRRRKRGVPLSWKVTVERSLTLTLIAISSPTKVSIAMSSSVTIEDRYIVNVLD